MKIRVYDNRGREKFVAIGDKVPVGWFDENCQPIEKEKIVKANRIAFDFESPTQKTVLFLVDAN